MPDVLPIQPPGTRHQTWRRWICSSIWLRVCVAVFLIATALIFSLWPTRKAVWAVLIANGTISVGDRRFANSRQNMKDHLPELAQPVWQWSRTTAKEWLAQDNSVFGVNLSHSVVDHQWMPRLAPMKSLQILSLDQKQIGPGIASLGKISTLRDIKVMNPGPETALETLLYLPRLERLFLVDPQSSTHGFGELGKHQFLRELDLSVLDVESREWALLLHQCRDWSNVSKISIRSLYALTPGLETLQSCPSLRTLEISAPVTHSDALALSGMRQLSSLVINANRMNKHDLLLLSDLNNLRTLKVYASGDGELPLDELRQLLPDCQIEGGP